MYHEATIKFKIKHHRNKTEAKEMAEIILDEIKEYEESAISFIEKPELLEIKEIGIACDNCKYYTVEEVCIGDRGFGIEFMNKHYCEFKSEWINPFGIDFCDFYSGKGLDE